MRQSPFVPRKSSVVESIAASTPELESRLGGHWLVWPSTNPLVRLSFVVSDLQRNNELAEQKQHSFGARNSANTGSSLREIQDCRRRRRRRRRCP